MVFPCVSVKNLPAMWETWVQSLGWEDPLEKGKATDSIVQAGFRKGRGTRDQIANICWIIKKAREFQRKTSTSALLTMPKPLTVWITINCGKF